MSLACAIVKDIAVLVLCPDTARGIDSFLSAIRVDSLDSAVRVLTPLKEGGREGGEGGGEGGREGGREGKRDREREREGKRMFIIYQGTLL